MFQNIYFTAWNANGQTIGRCSEKGGSFLLHNTKIRILIQARIAQLVAYQLGTGEVSGSDPGKAENFSVKISNWIV